MRSIGPVNDVSVPNRLAGFRQRPQRIRVGLDLGRFTRCQEELDSEHDGLVDASAIFRGGVAQLCFELGREP